jgi:hypothetical protein
MDTSFSNEARLKWIQLYAPSALSDRFTNYSIRYVPLSQLSAEDFYAQHFMQHKPVLVGDSFGLNSFGGTSAISALGALNDIDLFLHEDIATSEADVTAQVPGDVMHATDYFATETSPVSRTCADVCSLLSTRRDNLATLANDHHLSSLYAKISTTHSMSLSGCVAGFLNVAEPLRPVVHPMLLSPGAYFSWAFIGEALSGSKTHVDVMGSDAWLVVLQGRKLWAICHPLDKHLIMEEGTGEFANMLNIDAVRFPRAKYARISYFIQKRGDAIFVPGDAPHTVINLEFSTSITFNFMYQKGSLTWRRMMQRVVDEDTAEGVLDIVLRRKSLNSSRVAGSIGGQLCSSLTVRLHLPPYCFDTPSIATTSQPPLATDYGARVILGDVHAAINEQYGQLFRAENLRSVGWPQGWEVQPRFTGGGGEGRRMIWTYIVDDTSMEVLLDRCCIPAQDSQAPREVWLSAHYNIVVDTACNSTEDAFCASPPLHLCSAFSSHIGLIPSMPPISVVFQQMWPCDASWTYKPLVAMVQERRKRAAAAAADSTGSQHDTVAPLSTWHYSRFPWTSHGSAPQHNVQSAGAAWSCLTYLFYSSPYVVGPVNLYPMLDDRTLQSCDALAQVQHVEQQHRYDPHFEEFCWDVNELLQPCARGDDDAPLLCLLDLGDDLVAELCKKLLLTDWGSSFLQFCSRHAMFSNINSADWATIGIEKLAILALYFSCRPGVVGFTYNFTFRNVTEPSTICLSGSAADKLLKRMSPSPLAALATRACAFIEGASSTVPAPITPKDIADELSAIIDSVPHGRDWLRNVVTIKQRDAQNMFDSEALDDTQERERCASKIQRAMELVDALL